MDLRTGGTAALVGSRRPHAASWGPGRGPEHEGDEVARVPLDLQEQGDGTYDGAVHSLTDLTEYPEHDVSTYITSVPGHHDATLETEVGGSDGLRCGSMGA